MWAKNDVKDERYLYEAKRTDNVKSISIKISDVDALEAHAADESLEPVMYIEIAGRFFMLCPEWVWENR